MQLDERKQFLSLTPPFSKLSSTGLDQAVKHLHIGHAKAGQTLSYKSEAAIVVLRTGSVEIRNRDGGLLDKLSSGDCFLFSKDETSVTWEAQCLEDSLLYFFDEKLFDSLGDDRREFQDFFHGATNVRLNRVVNERERNYCLNQCVEELMITSVVSCEAHDTIRSAAEKMSASKVSSLLIEEDGLIQGIVTDRDLRSRVLAAGVDSSEAVAQVMTSNPKTIRPQQTVYEAQLLMMRSNIHHLPVVENGRAVGILSINDFVRAQNSEPVYLIQAMNRAKDVPTLEENSKRLPELIEKMIRANVRAHEIGKIITSITDSITQQLIYLAKQRFGEPPCGFAWVVFGSQARADQMLGSDQDNGLILERPVEGDDAQYFEQFAGFVNEGLDRCGLMYCPGGIMAMTEKWRQPLDTWRDYFSKWINEPEPKALMHASIFYDIRHVEGERQLTTELINHVSDLAQKNTIFQACMSENALQSTPPLGFFKQFVLEKDGNHRAVLDLKHRGTVPIVALTRLYCLAHGIRAVNTVDRLIALEKSGKLTNTEAGNLRDAHEFIASLRLENQSQQVQRGDEVSNNLDPKTFSPLVRHQLKDAFAVVAESQRLLKMRFGHGAI